MVHDQPGETLSFTQIVAVGSCSTDQARLLPSALPGDRVDAPRRRISPEHPHAELQPPTTQRNGTIREGKWVEPRRCELTADCRDVESSHDTVRSPWWWHPSARNSASPHDPHAQSSSRKQRVIPSEHPRASSAFKMATSTRIHGSGTDLSLNLSLAPDCFFSPRSNEDALYARWMMGRDLGFIPRVVRHGREGSYTGGAFPAAKGTAAHARVRSVLVDGRSWYSVRWLTFRTHLPLPWLLGPARRLLHKAQASASRLLGWAHLSAPRFGWAEHASGQRGKTSLGIYSLFFFFNLFCFLILVLNF